MTTHQISEILKNLNPEQIEAVTVRENPLVIIAGAGSGKTRVLTRRIAYRIATGDADARHTLAVTFTKKAATEIKHRLEALNMREQIEAHTFHAAALRILQRFWESKEITPYELIESKFKIVSDAISSLGANTKTYKSRTKTYKGNFKTENEVAAKSLVSAVIAEIEWAKARGLTPRAYSDAVVAHRRNTPLTPTEMAQIFSRYEELKSKLHKMDYDDLIIGATKVLNSDPMFSAAEHYRMRHLYVDEFQDINPVQMSLVNALTDDRLDLCVVGDPNQAIYSWNGADPTLLTSLQNRHHNTRTVLLSNNYRSTPQILSLAGSILNGGSHPNKKLIPNLPDGPTPVIRGFNDDKTEAQSVARLAKHFRQPGTGWCDIAVLARTNSQLIPIQKMFKESGVPAFLAGETNYLNQSEIRAIVNSLERQNSFLRGNSLFAWLEGIVENSLSKYAEVSSASDNLNIFLELSREYLSTTPDGESRGLALWLKTEARNALDENAGESVTLTTFHKAKGLEWRTVFIVGMEDGLVPIAHAESKEAVLEEQRLLYVAITRAKRDLILTWARQRIFNERYLKREPSPYLATLQDEIQRISGHIATSEHALSSIRKARRNLQDDSSDKMDLSERQKSIMESLRLWRSQKSKELGVPAHIILHDFALVSVAVQEPSSLEALSKIAGVGSTKASKFGKDLLQCVEVPDTSQRE
ncbi:MAG: ATP-dependent DNA helicase UvrD2 [Acidimicrobiaceae bacterium]|nr:ATP-dependent DNA helicase UvrD2 [Acidimicrobiaceae bacterium]